MSGLGQDERFAPFAGLAFAAPDAIAAVQDRLLREHLRLSRRPLPLLPAAASPPAGSIRGRFAAWPTWPACR